MPGTRSNTQNAEMKEVSLGAWGFPENGTGAGDQEMFWFPQEEWTGFLKLPASWFSYNQASNQVDLLHMIHLVSSKGEIRPSEPSEWTLRNGPSLPNGPSLLNGPSLPNRPFWMDPAFCSLGFQSLTLSLGYNSVLSLWIKCQMWLSFIHLWNKYWLSLMCQPLFWVLGIHQWVEQGSALVEFAFWYWLSWWRQNINKYLPLWIHRYGVQ